MNVVVAPPQSPFKGLVPFGDSDLDALLFFGREREREIVIANLMASRLTVLYGPSGVGKTSLLRAGVARSLHEVPDATVVVASSWSGEPTVSVRDAIHEAAGVGLNEGSVRDALERAVDATDGDVYVILDQFEEYFLYHEHDEGFATELADALRQTGLRANFLIGIREDALAKLDAFKGRIPGLFANSLGLDRLDRRAGETAIVGPVNAYNALVPPNDRVEVEPELVAAVLDEVAAGRVDLGRRGRGSVGGSTRATRIEAPYLQLVLERLWDVERVAGSRRLQLATLAGLGGATRIVEEHLDHAMAGLSPRQQDAAAAMYNHLVTPSGTKIAHGVRDLAGYAAIDEREAAAVLKRLSDDRIIRAGENGGAGSYEIFHDVLADAVLAWRTRHDEERRVRQAHAEKRRAWLVAIAAFAGLVVVAVIAIFALVERSDARSQADRARARELVAKALNLFDTNPAASVRFAYDAARTEPRVHEEDVLRNALSRDRLRTTVRTGAPVTVAGFAPGDRRILVAGADGKIRLYRRGSTHAMRVFDQRAPVVTALFSPDHRFVIGGSTDGNVRIWSADTGILLRTLRVGAPVRTLVFSRDGGLLVGGAANGTVRIWSAPRWRLRRSFRTHTKGTLVSAAIDPSGRRVFTVTEDRFLRVYSTATGKLLRTLEHDGFVRAVVFSPNGKLLLTSDNGGTIRLWRVTDLQLVRTLHGAQRNVPVAVWSRDGTKVAAASSDGTARVWDTATGTQIAIAIGHTNEVTSVAFNPAGDAIVSTSSDHTARVWDKGGRLTALLAGHTSPVTSAVFSSDGRSVLTASEDGTARLWDPGSEPDLVPVARGSAPLTSLDVSADGRRVLIGDTKGTVRVVAVPSGRLLRSFRVGRNVTDVAFGPRGPRAVSPPATAIAFAPGRSLVAIADRRSIRIATIGAAAKRTLRPSGVPVHDLAFSPDGRTLAIALDDRSVQLWDVDSGRRLRTLRGHRGPVTSVAYSRDGRLLVTASMDRDARIYDARTGRGVRVLHGHFGPVLAARFSPDGRWVVTAGPTTAGLWKTATGEQAFLRGPTQPPLTGAAFVGSDGRTIATVGRDRTLRLFDCSLCGTIHDLLALARVRLGVR